MGEFALVVIIVNINATSAGVWEYINARFEEFFKNNILICLQSIFIHIYAGRTDFVDFSEDYSHFYLIQTSQTTL